MSVLQDFMGHDSFLTKLINFMTSEPVLQERRGIVHTQYFHYVALAILFQCLYAKEFELEVLYVVVPEKDRTHFERHFVEFTNINIVIIHDTIVYIVYETTQKDDTTDASADDENQETQDDADDLLFLKEIYELQMYFDFTPDKTLQSSKFEFEIPLEIVQSLSVPIQKLYSITSSSDSCLNASLSKLIDFQAKLFEETGDTDFHQKTE